MRVVTPGPGDAWQVHEELAAKQRQLAMMHEVLGSFVELGTKVQLVKQSIAPPAPT